MCDKLILRSNRLISFHFVTSRIVFFLAPYFIAAAAAAALISVIFVIFGGFFPLLLSLIALNNVNALNRENERCQLSMHTAIVHVKCSIQ